MKAMILAAGLGKRMRPLTEKTPKPLLRAGGKYLIEYHLERLAKAGFKEVVVNTHWLGEQLPEALGYGERWGMSISYSHEPVLLETAGGIKQALPKLIENGDSPFLILNGDVYLEFDLDAWLELAIDQSRECLAYLGVVANPEHHPEGDFYLESVSHRMHVQSEAQLNGLASVTYAGVALFRPSLFKDVMDGPSPLAPLLKSAVADGLVKGQMIDGYWMDVGTPERLKELNERL